MMNPTQELPVCDEDRFGFRDRRARFLPVELPNTLMEPTEQYHYV